jgi:hypothetical protein
MGGLRDILEATGQGSDDVSNNNKGIIRILDDEGKEAAVQMLLDPDNQFNSSSKAVSSQRSSNMSKAAEFIENKGDVLSQTLDDVFKAAENIKYYKRAFEVHQPLRRLFWDAFKEVKKADDVPDAGARKKFWDVCAQVTNNPQAAIMPVWRSQTGTDGKTEFIRDEIFVPQVVLYRPWTGEEADKIIHPINVSPDLKKAVKKEHEAMIERMGQTTAPHPIEPEKKRPPLLKRLLNMAHF